MIFFFLAKHRGIYNAKYYDDEELPLGEENKELIIKGKMKWGEGKKRCKSP